jgi:hypothetical protein
MAIRALQLGLTGCTLLDVMVSASNYSGCIKLDRRLSYLDGAFLV